MEQLSGLDALFLHAEMHGMPMHFSLLSIYDPSSSDNKIEFRNILDIFEKNILHSVPLLRYRLLEVPFNLDQPYWVEDHNFDLVYHVRHIALPKPGNWPKLCSLTANLHAQPLNRNRPLWEAYIIDGLDCVEGIPAGCFAILLKVHHAMMDGRTGMAIFNSLHSVASGKPYQAPETTDAIDEGQFISHEPGINMPRLLAKAVWNNVHRSGDVIRLMGRAVRLYGNVRQALANHEFRQLEKPRTRFNGTISPRRVVDRIKIPLSDIALIRAHVSGKTINDVALAVIGGALRKYLLSKDELPEDPLVAALPMNTRHESDNSPLGNRINITNVSLCTNLAKPLDRLQRVHEEVQAGKAYASVLGDNIVSDAMNSFYSVLVAWGVKASLESGLLEKFPPANNTVVTNIPGAKEALFLGGAQLVDSFGMGPLIPNTGLFHAVSSTHDHLTISFTADRQKMDDPDFYVQCLQDAVAELLAAV